MEFKEYIPKALRTEVYDGKIKERLTSEKGIRLIHACMGMQTESAEFTDAMKKHFFYGKTIDIINLEEELGDLLWYMAIAIDACGFDAIEIMKKNITKLQVRYPEKFTEEKALNRDTKKEMEHF